MNLQGLLPLLRSVPAFRGLTQGAGTAVVLEEAKAAVVAALFQEHPRPLLLVTPRAARAASFVEQLQSWLGGGTAVHLFPEPDVLPHERLDPDAGIVAQRLRVLHALSGANGSAVGPSLIVAPVHALAPNTVLPDRFRESTVSLVRGGRLDWERVARLWFRAGYRRVETVRLPGEMARRGGIIDIFPPHLDEPARVELWGDEIDNIRLFDPASQRSLSLTDAVDVPPARELLPDPDLLERAEKGPKPARSRRRSPAAESEAHPTSYLRNLQRLLAGEEIDSHWFYAPVFNHATLDAYLPENALVVLDEPPDLKHGLEEMGAQADQAWAALREAGEIPPDFPRSLAGWDRLLSGWRDRARVLELRRWGGEGEEALGFTPVPGYGGRLREALNDIRRAVSGRERVVITSHQSHRLAELLADEDITVQPVEDLHGPPGPGSIALVHGAVPGGWRITTPSPPEPGGPPEAFEGSGSGALRLLTDAELFGFVKEGRRKASRRASYRGHPLQGLAAGDYVVHVEHGVGRFVETTTMEEQPGARKEYLLIEYAAGGRLFVPADQVDRLTRYVGQGGYTPSLNQLGTQEWERAKARVKAAAANIARELLETSAARQLGTGTGYGEDTVWQQELEASFPYVETPDQLQAVRDVKGDLQQPRPMDRLVCGDVGYGKTEVAVRAAFKAAQEGAQVAMLVPTTVLAQQHFQTFSQRLGAFPVRVATLSRFQSDREQRRVIDGLRSGEIDIVIGTHRLVQKDVEFRNLGLLIVDEEQRFGVLHKEYFKRLRRSVDVLTLSATPIPRTLYMSLVNVRDMSVMETPPEERLPIKTYVMEFDEGTIRQAILRELERGGQVFFVHNRVQTMGQVVYRLRQLVPEASFGAAHGQMPEELLERAMLDFTQGEYDVLVCSTIIESGLDLPNVNTIVINDADKLGLAQLYQLRGRVGRGSSRAYAYLLFTRNKALTERAERRLQAVFEATDLGAGYYIAMKDLEIRGAGNLLGVEQSGHIGAVGFDLYCRILASAVEDAKAEQAGLPPPSLAPVPPATSVDLGLASYLPDDYVQELDTRLDLYRRLAATDSLDEVEEIEQELHDRFGPLPVPAGHLLFSVRIKLRATRAGAESVGRRGDTIVVQLHEGLHVDTALLPGQSGVHPGNTQVRVAAAGNPGRWGPVLEDALRRMGGG